MVPILTTTSTIMCPHAGQALPVPTTPGFIDGGQPLVESDLHLVVGCTFAPGGVYTPCVLVRWSAGATMAKASGVPLLLQTSIGVCYNAAQAPQGIAIVVQTQQRVRGI
jgi:hypothetical protein